MIDAVVQAHPARREMAEALAERIGGRVVWDPAPDDPLASPWRTYRHCIETADPDASHILIAQDDVEVCRGFREAVEAAVAARSDSLLVFCITGQSSGHRLAVQQACREGRSWAELRRAHWVSAICNCWPLEMARDLLVWVDEQNYKPSFRSDDEIIGRWATARGVVPLASVPSLADHPDREPSLLGRRFRNGQDPNRRTLIFVDEDCDHDAASIDWSRG